MDRVVTLGVAGSGKASPELIFDTLCDQFSIGAQDSEGYYAASSEFEIRLTLPATAETASDGVITVCEWAVRCELPYVLLSDGDASNPHVEFMTSNVHEPQDVIAVKTADVYPQLLAKLALSQNPMLLLLLDDGKFGDDEALEKLTADALAAAIPVFDLGRAFMEVGWDDLTRFTRPEVEVLVEPDGQFALAMTEVNGERIELSSRELTILRTAFAEVDEVLERIAFLSAHITPLRRAVVGAREALLPPPPAAGPGRGRRQRMEVLDEETGEWVPAGRGRPRQGVPRRYVTKSEKSA